MSDIPVHTGHLPAIAIDEKSDRHGAGRFDYGPLPQEKVGALRACCARIRTQIMKTVAPIIAIGRELIAAKKILRHGAFGDWVESECGFTMRTAQNYMKASRLSSKYESVSHLPPATLYRMCGRRTPVELVDKVVACASRGEEVTEAEFDRMQREFRKSTIRVVRPNAQDDGSADDEREGNFDSRFGKKDSSTEDRSLAEGAEDYARWMVDNWGEAVIRQLILIQKDGRLLEALELLARKIAERGARSRPLFSDADEVPRRHLPGNR